MPTPQVQLQTGTSTSDQGPSPAHASKQGQAKPDRAESAPGTRTESDALAHAHTIRKLYLKRRREQTVAHMSREGADPSRSHLSHTPAHTPARSKEAVSRCTCIDAHHSAHTERAWLTYHPHQGVASELRSHPCHTHTRARAHKAFMIKGEGRALSASTLSLDSRLHSSRLLHLLLLLITSPAPPPASSAPSAAGASACAPRTPAAPHSSADCAGRLLPVPP